MKLFKDFLIKKMFLGTPPENSKIRFLMFEEGVPISTHFLVKICRNKLKNCYKNLIIIIEKEQRFDKIQLQKIIKNIYKKISNMIKCKQM